MLLEVTSNDILLVIVVICLLIICLTMVYLTYSQSIKINKKEYKNDEIEDLKKLSKELESVERKENIDLTSYEEEQENNAIISYDELIKNKNKQKEYKEDIKKEIYTSNNHEEEILKELKELIYELKK